MFIKVYCRGVEQHLNILHIERMRRRHRVEHDTSSANTCIHLTSGKPEFLEVDETLEQLTEKIDKGMSSNMPLV